MRNGMEFTISMRTKYQGPNGMWLPMITKNVFPKLNSGLSMYECSPEDMEDQTQICNLSIGDLLLLRDAINKVFDDQAFNMHQPKP